MASERRARNRNDRDGLPDRRRQEADQELQQEEQVEVEKRQEPRRDAAQDAIGNQGVAALLGLAPVRPGEAGFASGAQQAPEEEGPALQHGGDDPPEDGPLTLDDLVRSWNPRTRRGQDAAAGAAGDPDGLPPEDEALLNAVLADRSPLDLPASSAPDALLQPSEEVIARDLRPFVRQAVRWASGSVLHRAWGWALSPPAPALVDPDGRLVLTRARVAASATLLAVDALGDRRVSPLVGFTLELAARGGWVDRALGRVDAQERRLPQAAALLEALLAEDLQADDGPAPRAPDGAAGQQLGAALADLLDLPSAETLLPSLAPPGPAEDPDDDDDDPLGVDDLLAAALGPVDPLAGVYDAALQGAERLAGGAARLRVHAAGMLAAVAEVCAAWSAGVPRAALEDAAAALDAEVGESLRLLVEVGRAIQARAVAPAGIRNGLRRVARGLDGAARRLVARASAAVGGVLPELGEVPGMAAPAGDPLDEARAEGEPPMAVAWLGTRSAGLERDAAAVLCRAAGGEVAGLLPEVRGLADRAAAERRPALSGALAITAGSALLRTGATGAAEEVAEAQIRAATARRNGVWLAAAALLAIEARRSRGDEAGAAAVRHRAARACWALGARSALSLLLRWRPPEAA